MAISRSLEFSSPVRKPSHEVDVEMFTFIERYATNLARWDLLIFFGRNPSARDDASKIAEHVGRAERTVEKELDDLVYLGILHTHRNSDGVLYGLTHASATRRSVMRLARDFAARA
jgi:DNA-binding MarR family transcriptional regulator